MANTREYLLYIQKPLCLHALRTIIVFVFFSRLFVFISLREYDIYKTKKNRNEIIYEIVHQLHEKVNTIFNKNTYIV